MHTVVNKLCKPFVALQRAVQTWNIASGDVTEVSLVRKLENKEVEEEKKTHTFIIRIHYKKKNNHKNVC